MNAPAPLLLSQTGWGSRGVGAVPGAAQWKVRENAALASAGAAAGSAELQPRFGRGGSMDLAAVLAHEIRNPLASLELFTALLEQEPARSAEWLGHLRAGVRGLSGTVDNVLALRSGVPPRMQPLAIGRVVASAVDFVRPLAAQAGLRLRLHGSYRRAMVPANEAALRQLVLNLVVNAIRHTSTPGAITVSLTPQAGKRLALAVADTGSGIAPEHLPHVFEAGWSANGQRCGLGLAVCQRIASQHGAVLQVSSTPQLGTRFQMELTLL